MFFFSRSRRSVFLPKLASMQYYSDFAVKAAKDLLSKTYKFGACTPSPSLCLHSLGHCPRVGPAFPARSH